MRFRGIHLFAFAVMLHVGTTASCLCQSAPAALFTVRAELTRRLRTKGLSNDASFYRKPFAPGSGPAASSRKIPSPELEPFSLSPSGNSLAALAGDVLQLYPLGSSPATATLHHP